MRRIRWFKLTSKSEIGKIERQIRARQFLLNNPVSSGFRIEYKDNFGLLGQFVHKSTFDRKIILPSGEEFSQEIVNIEITKFGIDYSTGQGLLYLVDSPRSTTHFFSALSEATKFSCAIDPIEVNIEKWIEHLNFFCNGLSITYLDVSGITLSRDVKARIAVAGEKDVAAIFREVIPLGRHGRVEHAKIRYPFGDENSIIIDLSCRASFKTTTPIPAEEVKILQKAMLLAVS